MNRTLICPKGGRLVIYRGEFCCTVHYFEPCPSNNSCFPKKQVTFAEQPTVIPGRGDDEKVGSMNVKKVKTVSIDIPRLRPLIVQQDRPKWMDAYIHHRQKLTVTQKEWIWGCALSNIERAYPGVTRKTLDGVTQHILKTRLSPLDMKLITCAMIVMDHQNGKF